MRTWISRPLAFAFGSFVVWAPKEGSLLRNSLKMPFQPSSMRFTEQAPGAQRLERPA